MSGQTLTAALALGLLAPGTGGAADKGRLPNFVIVYADDLGYADLGCYGAKGYETPNLDRMAREGRRFTDFYVAQGVCSASRTALLTGCYPNRVGILGALGPASKHGISAGEKTLAGVLKARGYATAIYGKWHLGHHPPFLPTRHGFDDYFGLPYSNDMWPKHPTAKFPPLPLIEGEKVVATNPDQSKLTGWYTERAVRFIEKNKDRPFFLYVPHTMPHVPLFASAKFKGTTRRGLYGDVIAEIDWSVGQILAALRKQGLDEQTLVLFASDNGPWLSYGDHAGSAGSLREGKGTTWEGGVRVPFLARWPGKIPAGTVCRDPAMTIDVLPTFAKLAGASLPRHAIDGKDVWPLLAGQKEAKSPHEAYFFYWDRGLEAVRGGKWKLHFPHPYRTLSGKPGAGGKPGPYRQARTELALYDLEKDPGETADVAAKHPEVVARLKRLADGARKELGDSATKQKGAGVRQPGRAESRTPAGRPNVVVILADDLGWADLGCYGSRFHRTPALDRLAAAGLRFTDAYAACPVCSPTRAALLTGKAPARLGLTDWLPGRPDRPDQALARPALAQQLPLAETTLAKALQKAGYATGHVGKWHLGGKGFGPQQHGFDVNVGGDQAGSPLSYFAPFRNKDRFMPGLEKAPAGEYLTDRLTAEAERFLDGNKDRPFFLYLAHYAVHIPLRAKADLVEKYPGKAVPGRQSNAIYAAMLESLDESVGRVLRKLEELKLSDRTIVAFTSDNGGLVTLEGPNTPPTINAPLREGKGYLYEGGLRVPLLVKWPGAVKPGGTTSAPVVSHDLYPTLLAACGVEARGTLDGVSLLPLLRGGAAPEREALYWHYPHYSNQGGRPGGAVRMGQHKLIEFYEDGRRELYDLKADPGEHRNLAKARPEVVKRLAARLEGWRKEVGARMPRPNPAYRPNPQGADGVIALPARLARVQGTQLRYEPLPHKNALGYWTEVEDRASWEFTAARPGTFGVEVLQGCGTGQGGSEIEVEVGGKALRFTVEDTGGFQKFKARAIGGVKLDRAGRYTLTVRARSKAKGAVMDLRQVVLRPVKE